MGTSQSTINNDSSNIKLQFNYKYNLIPSHSGHEFNTINLEDLGNILYISDKNETEYIDLRNEFPPIINVREYPFNPIASISYLIQYSMIKNKLPIFPPSMLFIYRNISFYEKNPKLLNLEIIFRSILNYGYCSENEFKSIQKNIEVCIPKNLYLKSEGNKFMDIYKVENDLEILKLLLKAKYPIVVGFTMYYELVHVHQNLPIPNKERDNKIGGLSGVLVGYIDDRESFIIAMTYGDNVGISGFLLVPYDFILDNQYTFERYILILNKTRIEGFLEKKREVIQMESKKDYSNESESYSIFS